MKDINIFCFGFGQVAKNFIKKLNKEKFNIKLSTTSRDKTKKKGLTALIIKVFNSMRMKLTKI